MTEIPNVYQLTNVGTAPKFNTAFAQGCGAKIYFDGKLRPGPVALWGEHKWFKTLNAAIAEGRTWYYGDHAYFGRGIYFRVTKNALQHNGMGVASWARFTEVAEKIPHGIPILPQANQHNGFIMVCPPSEALSERSGFTQAQWTERVVAKLKKFTKREIQIRQKPKINRTPAPFLEAMRGAFAAVTYTGNIATESYLGGYPAFVTGPHPSAVFGNTDLANIERPNMPHHDELMKWASILCQNQWTLDEIRAGKCWGKIQ